MNKPHIFCEPLCTYGQAAQIILKHKGIEFLIDSVDANERADWLADASPICRLPVLKAENRFIFGTFAICEYIDEAYPHSIQPKKALDKAINRSWMEFSVLVRNSIRQLVREKNRQELDVTLSALSYQVGQLNGAINRKPFFNGDKFSVLDAIYAPLLFRLSMMKTHFNVDLLDGNEKIAQWLTELMGVEDVNSTLNDYFVQDYLEQSRRFEGLVIQ